MLDRSQPHPDLDFRVGVVKESVSGTKGERAAARLITTGGWIQEGPYSSLLKKVLADAVQGSEAFGFRPVTEVQSPQSRLNGTINFRKQQ